MDAVTSSDRRCSNCAYRACAAGQGDTVNPAHYTRFAIQPLTFITRNNLDYLQGNIIKYICRYPFKGGVTDLKKARRYLDELITKEKAHNDTNV